MIGLIYTMSMRLCALRVIQVNDHETDKVYKVSLKGGNDELH